MTTVSIVLAALAGSWILAYHRANGVAWSLGLAALSAAVTFATGAPLLPRLTHRPASTNGLR